MADYRAVCSFVANITDTFIERYSVDTFTKHTWIHHALIDFYLTKGACMTSASTVASVILLHHCVGKASAIVFTWRGFSWEITNMVEFTYKSIRLILSSGRRTFCQIGVKDETIYHAPAVGGDVRPNFYSTEVSVL